MEIFVDNFIFNDLKNRISNKITLLTQPSINQSIIIKYKNNNSTQILNMFVKGIKINKSGYKTKLDFITN
jgi:hypothetical protein